MTPETPVDWIFFLVRWFYRLAIDIPFSIKFFFWDFSFGHVIYGSMLVSVSVIVLGRFIHNKIGDDDKK